MNATLTPPQHIPSIDTREMSLRDLGEVIRRMWLLTERGVGVSEILEQAPSPRATAEERFTVAVMLRAMFWRALRTGRAPAGIKNNRRDLERTLRYIDTRITPLAEAAKPGSARNVALPAIQPMATDDYGAEIDVRDGPRRLRVLTPGQSERTDVAAVIERILGEDVPPVSVTVNLPASWQPSVPVLRALCHAIHSTYTATWAGGYDTPA